MKQDRYVALGRELNVEALRKLWGILKKIDLSNLTPQRAGEYLDSLEDAMRFSNIEPKHFGADPEEFDKRIKDLKAVRDKVWKRP